MYNRESIEYTQGPQMVPCLTKHGRQQKFHTENKKILKIEQ
jgi:hypothetical protein